MDKIQLKIKAMAINESLARGVISAYAARCNPTLEVLSDIKTSVSEAVTNAIIHAYGGENDEKDICINAEIVDNNLHIEIIDYGVGIPDVIDAMTDFHTTKPNDERSGLGFTIMGSFMDSLEVTSKVGEGTMVKMTKKLAK